MPGRSGHPFLSLQRAPPAGHTSPPEGLTILDTHGTYCVQDAISVCLRCQNRSRCHQLTDKRGQSHSCRRRGQEPRALCFHDACFLCRAQAWLSKSLAIETGSWSPPSGRPLSHRGHRTKHQHSAGQSTARVSQAPSRRGWPCSHLLIHQQLFETRPRGLGTAECQPNTHDPKLCL